MAEPGRRKRVLLIVSGGIAAYKTPDLVRKLRGSAPEPASRGSVPEVEIQVITTAAASAFVTELALATVSGRPVRSSLLDPAEEGRVGHIELADWPDLVLVAPASADLIARAAHGLANDLASTVLLATRAPVLWAPAMNTNMWQHPATVANLELLRARGALFVGPDRGELACGWIGEGRMMDPPIIVAAVRSLLQRDRSWVGRRVLVSAGPTRAYLDPVRFLSNASTGAMGFALAEAAAARGAEVVLVAGPVAEPTPSGVRRIDIETGAELLRACEQEFEAAPIDLLAMVAAVADLVPVEPAREKVAKEDVLARLSTMQWQAETDILATLSAKYGSQTRMLGFGAQTTDAESPEQVEQVLVREGAAKLARKGCHALFVNRVGVAGLGFASATNAGQLLFAGRQQGEVRVVDSGPARLKRELAAWMLDELARAWFDAERGPEFGAEQPHAGTELGPEPAQG